MRKRRSFTNAVVLFFAKALECWQPSDGLASVATGAGHADERRGARAWCRGVRGDIGLRKVKHMQEVANRRSQGWQ